MSSRQYLLPPACRVVSIRNLVDEDAAVRCETWIRALAKAMTIFFDCKKYSTSFCGGARLEWTFYGVFMALLTHAEVLTIEARATGLAEHTVAAAYAFEMVCLL